MPCLCRKKVPPMWFVLDPPKNSESTPTRQGPYTRATIVEMIAHGQLSTTKLLWTNERIFPNAKKPKSSRLVRIQEWRRMDQLPDPVLRKLQAEAKAFSESMDHKVQPPGVAAAMPPDANPGLHAYAAHAPPNPSAYPAPPPQGGGGGGGAGAQPYGYPTPPPQEAGAYAHHTPPQSPQQHTGHPGSQPYHPPPPGHP